ncbi:MAG: type II toxin-antitoxin system VapC family toxin [Solirubrobacterales bacterium]
MIFIDTSFLIAGFDERDPFHREATLLARQLAGRRIVASNHVRGESWTWFRRKRWHRKAVEFLDSLRAGASNVRVDFISEDIEADALDWLRRHDEREYSFVDATSFAYMRAKGIREALAFDGDFAAAGFTELRP